MAKGPKKSDLKVCLLSPHPMVLDEFHRLLKDSGFQISSKQLESMLAPDLRNFEVPRASVYVIDAHAARQATGALLGNILDQDENARLLVVGDQLKEADCFALLGVAGGGFWVPRNVLSSFVDTILKSPQGRRMRTNSPTELSKREQEVLSGLLENLANKELADRLHISERTVKFHVSNLLSKFGVRRRADLILLCYQRRAGET